MGIVREVRRWIGLSYEEEVVYVFHGFEISDHDLELFG